MNQVWLVVPLLMVTLAGCSKEAEPAPEETAAAIATAPPKPASFEAMDGDRDGKLTSAEHGKGIETVFQTMDADADGKVTPGEIDSGRTKVGWTDNVPAKRKIAAIDGDGDGALSKAEITAAGTAMFTQMDTSKDQSVDDSEWKSEHTQFILNPESLKVSN